MLAPLYIVLFDEVGALAPIEASHYVESLVVKGDGRVEVSSSIKTGNLSPSITANIVNFALVHRFAGKRGPDGIDSRTRTTSQDRCQGVGPPLEYHIPTLLKPFVYELIARLGSFAGFTAPCQKDSTLFILNRHEISRYLDIHNV